MNTNEKNQNLFNSSVNGLSSLKDFEGLANLSELYIRNNNISDLGEIYYLKKLRNLKILWLADNECALNTDSNYRLTVLRNLPHLQKLDNQLVTKEELERSLEIGRLIDTPNLLDSTKFSSSDINRFLMPLTDDLKALISSMEECECTEENDLKNKSQSKNDFNQNDANENGFENETETNENQKFANGFSECSSDDSNGDTIDEST